MPRDCDGWVWTLSGQLVYFTGTMTIGNERYLREDCQTMIVTRGGDWQTDYSRKVTLLVKGDLDPRRVHDPIRMRLKKLRAAAESELKGYHTCMVDQDGFAALLDRYPASCRRIEPTPVDREVILHPGIVVEPFGAPLERRNGSVHLPGSGLTLDLNQLDAGTEAHEQTVESLVRHLGSNGIVAYGPDHRGPEFDAGWRQGDTIWLAEVKSLRNTDQYQQIRLGVGQILDYASQVRAGDPLRHVQAALVLEQEPSDLQRWKTLAKDSNLVLSWAPNFRGLGVSGT